jgi:hypothetical protein
MLFPLHALMAMSTKKARRSGTFPSVPPTAASIQKMRQKMRAKRCRQGST